MNQSGGVNLEEYKTKPVIAVEFGIVEDATQGMPGSFDKKEIVRSLTAYKERGFLVGGLHMRPEVGRGEETEELYVSSVRGMLKSLGANHPFDWVKTSYYDKDGGVGPFARRSLMKPPDYGLLVMIEAEAWGSGISIDWDRSIVVGHSPEIVKMARKARLRLADPVSEFGGT